MNPKEVDNLIRLLDDTDVEIYQQIEARLVTYGRDVIPILESAWSKSMDALMQQRIENIIHKIQLDDLRHDLRVWANAEDNKEQKRIPLGTTAKMTCCAFWPGGRALTGHADGQIVLWDLEQGKELHRFPHRDVQITAVAIARDGRQGLSAHSDHSVHFYHLPAPLGKP